MLHRCNGIGLYLHHAPSKDSDQNLPRLICFLLGNVPFCRFCNGLSHNFFIISSCNLEPGMTSYRNLMKGYAERLDLDNVKKVIYLLSCQPRVTVMSCSVYKVIRDLESIDRLCINPILRIGLIHK